MGKKGTQWLSWLLALVLAFGVMPFAVLADSNPEAEPEEFHSAQEPEDTQDPEELEAALHAKEPGETQDLVIESFDGDGGAGQAFSGAPESIEHSISDEPTRRGAGGAAAPGTQIIISLNVPKWHGPTGGDHFKDGFERSLVAGDPYILPTPEEALAIVGIDESELDYLAYTYYYMVTKDGDGDASKKYYPGDALTLTHRETVLQLMWSPTADYSIVYQNIVCDEQGIPTGFIETVGEPGAKPTDRDGNRTMYTIVSWQEAGNLPVLDTFGDVVDFSGTGTFLGWKDDHTGDLFQPGDEIWLNQTRLLVAQWSPSSAKAVTVHYRFTEDWDASNDHTLGDVSSGGKYQTAADESKAWYSGDAYTILCVEAALDLLGVADRDFLADDDYYYAYYWGYAEIVDGKVSMGGDTGLHYPGEVITLDAVSTRLTIARGRQYEVRFDTAGGSPVDSIRVRAGMPINPDDVGTTTLDGYELDGWYRDEDRLIAWDFGVDTVKEDITLYAKWVNDGNGGNGGGNGGGNSGGGNGGQSGGNTSSGSPVFLSDPDVPLGAPPITEILDDDVPLGALPKTGGSGRSGGSLTGVLVLLAGALTGIRARREED